MNVFTSARCLFLTLALLLFTSAPSMVLAHCDTHDGPVLKEAKVSLTTGDITRLLKWVPEKNEAELKAAFKRALTSRKTDPQAVDEEFFNLLIRIHREGEGFKFTGVKPVGTKLPPAIVAADEALESGSSLKLTQLMTTQLLTGLRHRFQEALEKKRHADDSVAAGREYVAAYIQYVHYVEAVSTLISHGAAHEAPSETPEQSGDTCGGCGK